LIPKKLLVLLLVGATLVSWGSVVDRHPVRASTYGITPRKSADSYIKSACKEWAKTPKFSATTTKQLDAWLLKAQKTTRNALIPAVAASKLNRKWDSFVGHLVILQANMNSLQYSRTFADAKLWDLAVAYLKRTCQRILK
jgi:hypothetical protein